MHHSGYLPGMQGSPEGRTVQASSPALNAAVIVPAPSGGGAGGWLGGAPSTFRSGFHSLKTGGYVTVPARIGAPGSETFLDTKTDSSMPCSAAKCFRRMASDRPAGTSADHAARGGCDRLARAARGVAALRLGHWRKRGGWLGDRSRESMEHLRKPHRMTVKAMSFWTNPCRFAERCRPRGSLLEGRNPINQRSRRRARHADQEQPEQGKVNG